MLNLVHINKQTGNVIMTIVSFSGQREQRKKSFIHYLILLMNQYNLEWNNKVTMNLDFYSSIIKVSKCVNITARFV